MVGKKKPAQESPRRMLFPPRIPICEYFPLAENFSREFFLKTPWDPLGILLEGSQMVSRKIPIKKSGLTAVFPYRNPLKPKNAPGGKKNVGKNFFNTWGVLTYPQRNFSDGEQKETLQKN